MPSGNGLSGIPGHGVHNMFNPQIGGPPPHASNSLPRPHVTDLSPAEIYCQQHEVTATVCAYSVVFCTDYYYYLLSIALWGGPCTVDFSVM